MRTKKQNFLFMGIVSNVDSDHYEVQNNSALMANGYI